MKKTGREDTTNPLDIRTIMDIPPHTHASSDPADTRTLSPIESLRLIAEQFELSEELKIRLAEAQQDLLTLTGGGQHLLIRDADKMATVSVLRINLKDYIGQIEDARVAAKEPFLAASRMIDAKATAFKTVATASINDCVTALREWDTFQEAEARKVQEQLQREHDKKVEKEREQAAKKGREERPVAPTPVVQTPQKSTTVIVGGQSVTTTKIDNWVWANEHDPMFDGATAANAKDLGLALNLFDLNKSKVSKIVKAMKSTDPIPDSKVIGENRKIFR